MSNWTDFTREHSAKPLKLNRFVELLAANELFFDVGIEKEANFFPMGNSLDDFKNKKVVMLLNRTEEKNKSLYHL